MCLSGRLISAAPLVSSGFTSARGQIQTEGGEGEGEELIEEDDETIDRVGLEASPAVQLHESAVRTRLHHTHRPHQADPQVTHGNVLGFSRRTLVNSSSACHISSCVVVVVVRR